MRFSLALLLLSGCWPYLPGPYDDYIDGDSDGTGDVDTGEGTDADTDPDTDPDTEADTDPDTEADTDPDTDPDTEADTDPDTEPDTDPDTDLDTDPTGVTSVTIPELRNGEISEGTQVQISGVRVTSPQTTAGFWVQSYAEGLYQGIYVYDGSTTVVPVDVGDVVTVTGQYVEFVSGDGSLSEVVVTEPSAVQVTGTNGNSLVWQVAHSTLASSSSAELLESNLVSIGPSEVTVAPDNFGQYIVEPIGGGAPVLIDDLFYDDAPEVGDRYESITGVLNYAYGAFRIEPRFALDLPPSTSTANCPASLCIEDLLPGDIIVTEVGFNPSDTIGFDDYNEFVEVYNQSGGTVNLDGLMIRDNSNEAVVESDAVIPNNSYAVFFRGSNPAWGWGAFGVDRDGAYVGQVALSNGTGEQVSLHQPLGLEALAESQFYPSGQVGRSWSLDPRAFNNPGNANAWCYSTTFIGMQDRATPGTANDTCSNFFP